VGVLVLFAILAVVLAVGYWQWTSKQKRRQALATFALTHGLSFSAADPGGLLDIGFHLFGMGQGRGCENVMVGSWQGVPVREADYWYWTQSTDSQGRTSRSYSHFSVVVADVTAWLPSVRLEHENLLTRLADHVGMHDIEFESNDFNRAWNVKADDREFAFKLIDARMMTWLQQSGAAVCFEVSGGNVLVYRKRLGMEGVVALLDAVKGFVDHVPKLVWNEYGKAAS
jgi:hypothetical protein